MALSVITGPTQAALTLAELKNHLRIDDDITRDDADIPLMLAAATQEAEHLMGRSLLPQTLAATLDAFPCANQSITVRHGQVTEVQGIAYTSDTGTALTLSSDAYYVSPGPNLLRIAPVAGWPSTLQRPDAVTVTFTAGWPNAAAVPEVIKQWLKLRVGGFYENREAWTAGRPIERNEFIDSLLSRYRTITL